MWDDPTYVENIKTEIYVKGYIVKMLERNPTANSGSIWEGGEGWEVMVKRKFSFFILNISQKHLNFHIQNIFILHSWN